MEHTPGPWYRANTGNHQGLIISEITGENIAISYDKINAKLIAAAPDLLEACQKIVKSLEWEFKRSNTTYSGFENLKQAITEATD